MLAYVVLATLVAGIFSGPVQWSGETCSTSRECPSTGKFSYLPGYVYIYGYSAVMRTSMPGSAVSDTTEMKITSDVKIHAISACEFSATMTNVHIEDSNSITGIGSVPFADILSRFPVRFSMIGGVVGDVCPSAGDPAWSVNLKRAVISSLQNTMPDIANDHVAREVDVTGDCPVTYEVIGVGHVKKIKDMLACKGGRGLNSIIQGTPYSTNSGVKSLPIMKTGHQCEQRISPALSIVSECTCTEVHAFRPFSSWKGGAITEIRYSMKLKDHRREAISPVKFEGRKGIMYDHTSSGIGGVAEMERVKMALAGLCGQSEVTAKSPEKFTRLVEMMRAVDAETLTSLATSAICPTSKAIVRDVLAVLGTPASVKVIAQLVSSGEVSGVEETVLLGSFALIVNPTPEMIHAIVPLVTMKATRRVFISVSALLNNFCTHNEAVECSGRDHGVIAPVLKVMVGALGSDCSAVRPDTAFTIIKALTNIGHAAMEATPVLTSCVWNAILPMKMRVAAILAFERFPCEAIKNSNLGELMKDVGSDAELRIAAYKVIMKCPDMSTIDQVHTMLMGEESNQVGSYIWSHLGNLKESASPMSRAARKLLSDAHLSDKFNVDKRKFSRNIEWSAHHDAANLGARIESDVVFSAKSFVPRSAKIALDADVFGRNLPLFQMDGRIEGVEDVLQAMLAPETMGTASKNLIGSKTSSIDKASASWEVKMLGNTYGYGDVTGHDVRSAYEKINYIQVLMALAEHQKVDLLKNVKFIDTSFTIPTVAGIPLRMRVEGVASVSVAMNGKVDLRQMMASPRSLDIRGMIIPSAAVTIKASMTMDAEVTRFGLMFESTLFTSTAAEAVVVVKRGELVNIDLTLPKDKMHILQFKTDIKLIENEVVRAPTMMAAPKMVLFDACFPTAALGLEACAKISIPKPFANPAGAWFPLSGPAAVDVYLNKIDSIRSYHIELRNMMSAETGVQVWKVELSTPGGQKDREWSAIVSINYPNTMIKAKIHTPYAAVAVNALIINKADRKRIQIEAKSSTGTSYVIYADTPIIISGGSTHLKPIVRVVWADVAIATLDGIIEYAAGEKFVGKLRLQKVTAEPIAVKVSLLVKGENMKTEIEIQSPVIKAVLRGIVMKVIVGEVTTRKLRLAGTVGLYGMSPRQFVMENVMDAKPSASKMHYIVNSRWSTDLWDNKFDGKSLVEFAVTKTQMFINVHAGFDKVKRISYSQVLIWSMDPTSSRKVFGGKFSFVAPFKAIDYGMEMQSKFVAGRMVTVIGKITTGAAVYKTKAQVNIKSMYPLRLAINAVASYPGRDIKFVSTVLQTSPSTYKQTGTLQLAPELIWKVSSTVKTMAGRHVVIMKVESSEMAPWLVKLGAETAWPTFALHVNAVYGGRSIYAAMAKVVCRGVAWFGADAFERSAELSLSSPGRQFSAETKFAKTAAAVRAVSVVRWSPVDALGVRIEAMPARAIYSAHVQLPGDAWWNVKAGVKGGAVRAVVTSNVAGWTSHKCSGNVDIVGKSVTASGRIEGTALATPVRFTMIVKLPPVGSASFDVLVNTPFLGYEATRIRLAWSVPATATEAVQVKGSADFSGVVITFGGAWHLLKDMVSVNAVVRSPYALAPEVAVTLVHRATADGFATDAEFGMYAKMMWAITARGRNEASGKMSFEVTAKSPTSSAWSLAGWNAMTAPGRRVAVLTVAGAGVSVLTVESTTLTVGVSAAGYYADGGSKFEHSLSVTIADSVPIVYAVLYHRDADKIRYDVNLDYSGASWSLATSLIGEKSGWRAIQAFVTLETPLAMLTKHVYRVDVDTRVGSTSAVKFVGEMVPGGGVEVVGKLVTIGPHAWKFQGIAKSAIFQEMSVVCGMKDGEIKARAATFDGKWVVSVSANLAGGVMYSRGVVTVATPLAALGRFKAAWSHAILGERKITMSCEVVSAAMGLRGTSLAWSYTGTGWTSVQNHFRFKLSEVAAPAELSAAWAVTAVAGKLKVSAKLASRAVVWSAGVRRTDHGVKVYSVAKLDSRPVAVHVELQFSDVVSAVTVTVETPWIALPKLVVRYTLTPESQYTEAKLAVKWDDKWAADRRATLVTRYLFTAKRTVFTYRVVTPWAPMLSSQARFSLTYPLTSCDLVASFSHAGLATPAELRVNSAVRSAEDVDVSLTFSGPWPVVRSVYAAVKHTRTADFAYDSGLELRLPGYAVTLRNEMRLYSVVRFSTETTARYAAGGLTSVVVLRSSVQHLAGRLTKVWAEVKSTWAPVASLVLAVDHVTTGPMRYVTSASVAYGSDTKVMAMAKIAGIADIAVSAELMLPRSEMRFIRVRHVASPLAPALFTNSIHVAYSPVGHWKIVTTKSAGGEGGMMVKAIVTTPLVGWTRVAAEIVYLVKDGANLCTIKMTTAAGVYSMHYEVTGLTAVLVKVSSPLPIISSASMRLVVGTPNYVEFMLNGKKMSATAEYVSAVGAIKAMLVVKIPEMYSVSMNHVKVAGSTDYTTRGEMKISGMKPIQLVLKNVGDWSKEGETKASAAVGEAKFAITSKYHTNQLASVRKVKVDLPTNAWIATGTYEAHLKNSLGAGTDATAAVNTPYKNNGRYEMNLKSRKAAGVVKQSISITTPHKNYENWHASLMKQTTATKFTTRVTVNTPLKHANSLTGSIEHNAASDWSFVETHMAGEYNGQMMKIALDLSFKDAIRAIISIRTPFMMAREASVAFKHVASISKRGSLEATLNSVSIVALRYDVASVAVSKFTFELPGVASAMWMVDFAKVSPKIVKIDIGIAGAMGLMSHVTVDAAITRASVRGEDVSAIVIKMVVPSRAVTVTVNVGSGVGSVSSAARVQWSSDARASVSYRAAFTRMVSRRAEIILKAFVIVDLNEASRGVEVKHIIVPSRTYTTTLRLIHKLRGLGRSWLIKNVVVWHGGVLSNLLQVSHPTLPRTNEVSISAKKIGADLALNVEAIWSTAEKFSMMVGVSSKVTSYASFKYLVTARVQHVSSKMDISLECELANMAQKMSFGWVSKYMMMAGGKMSSLAIRAIVDKVDAHRSIISIQVRRVPSATGSVVFASAVKILDMQTVGKLEYMPIARAVVVAMDTSRGVGLKVVISCPNLANVKLVVSHRPSISAPFSKMAEVGLMVDSTNKLTMLSYWNPKALGEIKMIGVGQSVEIKAGAVEASVVYTKLAKDLITRVSTSTIRVPLMSTIGESINVAMHDVNAVKLTMMKGYATNEFYSKNIVDSAVKSGVYMRKGISSAAGAMAIGYKGLKVVVVGYIRAVVGWWTSLVQSVEAVVANMFYATMEMVKSWMPVVKAVVAYTKMWVDMVAAKVADILNWASVNAILRDVMMFDWQAEVWMPMVKAVFVVHRSVMDAVAYIASCVDYVRAMVDGMVSHPAIKWIMGIVDTVADNVSSGLELWNVREKLVGFAWVVVRGAVELFVDGASSFMSMARSGWIRHNPMTGNDEFALYMPFELSSFAGIPEVAYKLYARLEMLTSSVLKPITTEEWSLSDAFYKYKPNHDIRTWLPPFSAKATISGDGRFKTFDGKHFQFSGDCSYLLTADSQSDFKVYVNYMKMSPTLAPVRKSISVLSAGAEVEVTKLGKVIVKGVMVELPVTVGDFLLKRVGNSIIMVNGKGMKLECELVNDWCSLEISGWKYDKTSGMWGSYDNEPSTDMLPRGGISAMVAGNHFAHSWTRVNGCVSRENYSKATAYSSYPSSARAMCDAYFSMSPRSHFRRCTRIVSPAPFLGACLEAVSASFVPSVLDVCSVAATYMRQCMDAGIPVAMPKQCSSCGVAGSNLAIGSRSRLTTVPHQADVIVVVEHAACNSMIRDNIAVFVRRIVSSFAVRGISDIRFGVVGFGGKGINRQVHVKTINGKLTTSAEELIASSSKWEMLPAAGVYSSDPLAAIEFASSAYVFRRGASKSLVVMACGGCHEQSTTFADAKRALLSQDIRVTLVAPGAIGLLVKSASIPFLFGADATNLYTRKYLLNRAGNKALRSQAILPRDLCVALAMESSGAFFNSLQMKAERHEMKNFMAVVAEIIAMKGIPSACQVCSCVGNSMGNGQSICHACDSKRDSSSIFIDQPSYNKIE